MAFIYLSVADFAVVTVLMYIDTPWELDVHSNAFSGFCVGAVSQLLLLVLDTCLLSTKLAHHRRLPIKSLAPICTKSICCNCVGHSQDGSDLAGTNLIERLENELVAQTAALDSLLNAGGKRGRKQADLPLTQSQVSFFPLHHSLLVRIKPSTAGIVCQADTC